MCDDSAGGAEPAQAGYKSQGMGKEKGSNFPQERVSKCLPETVGSKKKCGHVYSFTVGKRT